ncbi:MAG: hypothetical protein ABL901_05805 [Hyphomicrobiaceae bacterium]
MSLSTTRTQTTSFGSPWLWVGLLAVASVLLSFRLSCAMPFAALAVLAALHMKKSEGLGLITLAWGLNQVVGYGFLHYPTDAQSFAWGAAIGVAALASFAAASFLAPRLAFLGRIPMMATTLAASFFVYEAVVYAPTAFLPASDLAYSWPIIGQIALVNALVFPALLLAHRGAELLGLTTARA